MQEEESRKAPESMAPYTFKSWSEDDTEIGDLIEILD